MKIRNVAIVGGTHGNELPGIQLVKLLQKDNDLIRQIARSFEVTTLIANEKAVQKNVRYVETDLNRCFGLKDLRANESPKVYEQVRAREIEAILGPKDNPKADFVFDLHNTTANTGILLCMNETDKLALEVAAYLKSVSTEPVSVSFWSGTGTDLPFLPTIGKSGMTVEVGPIPHSTFDFRTFNKTKKLIFSALEYLEKVNQDHERETVQCEIVNRLGSIPFPRDAKNQIVEFPLDDIGVIRERHVSLFSDLHGNSRTSDLVELGFKESDIAVGLHPLFMNEAAYYEKDVAMFLATKSFVNVEIAKF